MEIEAGRYTVGWTRLNAGGRSEEEGDSVGGRDRDGVPAWRVTVTAGDRMTARRMPPPSHFGKEGSLLPPPSIIADPWTATARTVGIRS